METQDGPVTDRQTWVMYYDGTCGFCAAVVDILDRIDLRDRVAWIPFQSLETLPAGLTKEDLDAAAYLDSDGRLEGGFYAFRRLTVGLPLLLPLAPLFWFPGVRFAGAAVYDWVARNRYRLPGATCEVPPPRRR
jgi:predicted DCC family thiol-disulfide oxidoreductase YuxK